LFTTDDYPLKCHRLILLLRIRATPGLKNAEHRRIRATPGLKNAEHLRSGGKIAIPIAELA
jgi:hypothetical protein